MTNGLTKKRSELSFTDFDVRALDMLQNIKKYYSLFLSAYLGV